MRLIYFLIVFIFLNSCKDDSIVLDFSHFEKPKITWELTHSKDTLLASIRHQFRLNKEWGTYLESDKTIYELGEAIEITLYNEDRNDAVAIQLHPSDQEALRPFIAYYLLEDGADKKIRNIPKEKLDKQVLSTNPLYCGSYGVLHYNFYSLTFYGLPDIVAKEFGYEGVDMVIKPGDEIKFRIIPPKVPGQYVVYAMKYSDKGIGAWGINKMIVSNLFEIQD